MPRLSGKQIVRVVYVSVQVSTSNDSPVTTVTHVKAPVSDADAEADADPLALLPSDEPEALADDADDWSDADALDAEADEEYQDEPLES